MLGNSWYWKGGCQRVYMRKSLLQLNISLSINLHNYWHIKETCHWLFNHVNSKTTRLRKFRLFMLASEQIKLVVQGPVSFGNVSNLRAHFTFFAVGTISIRPLFFKRAFLLFFCSCYFFLTHSTSWRVSITDSVGTGRSADVRAARAGPPRRPQSDHLISRSGRLWQPPARAAVVCAIHWQMPRSCPVWAEHFYLRKKSC